LEVLLKQRIEQLRGKFRKQVVKDRIERLKGNFRKEYITMIPYPYLTIPAGLLAAAFAPGGLPSVGIMLSKHKQNVDVKLGLTATPVEPSAIEVN